MTIAVWVLAAAAYGLAALRWLRVGQREHYLAGSVGRFAWRWWSLHPLNGAMAVTGLAALIGAFAYLPAALVAAVAVGVGPVGLGIRGRSAPLRWTARLHRLAVSLAALTVPVVLAGSVIDQGALVLLAAAVFLPLLLDLALVIMRPIEEGLSHKFVARAAHKLGQVRPLVVAITGSYGKTSTKMYLTRMISAGRSTVASPASFNNRMGLARAINEHLASGTEVFVAEMGTYGKGEIEQLCRWIRPAVGVITAIGPVHLERFGSLEAVAAAKAEILAGVRTAVLNVDDPRLASLADELNGGKEIVRCSVKDPAADVYIEASGNVWVKRELVGTLTDPSAFPGNVACAVGAAAAAGVPPTAIAGALQDLPAAEHRQSVYVSEAGFTVVDDTYNSNPTGAKAALATLQRLAGGGRRVLVTPGMVELGPEQRSANREFAAEAAAIATDIIVVGRTNRLALLEGTARGDASVMVMDSREEAVGWVRQNLAEGDVVLYENDLPDHYP